jgi:hypothetical protein
MAIRMLFDKMLKGEYYNIFISNICTPIEIESESYLINKIGNSIDKKNLPIGISKYRLNKESVELKCLELSKLVNKDSILSILTMNKTNAFAIVSDTSLVKYVRNKEREIENEKDSLKANRMKVELRKSKEFSDYLQFCFYMVPKVVEFSNPIFTPKHCILSFIIRQYRNDDNSVRMLVVLKKSADGWVIAKATSY